MLKFLGNLLDSNEKQLRRLEPQVAHINRLEPDFEKLPDEELRGLVQQCRKRYQEGESLDALLPEVFAAVREAGKRTLGQRHFDVQLMGGIVLHQGKAAEMKTGEGKTLVATLPVTLNALAGLGVHVVTVNDYLAKRDTQWMGPIYHLLGLKVGCIQHEAAFLYDPAFPSEEPRLRHLRPIARREAYLADVTYGTNNEFGFDYLRDNMVIDLSQCVQREPNYGIVDEVDNILIDEARTPLIISGPAAESTEHYRTFANLVPRLREGEDYTVDERQRVVSLTQEGIGKLEKSLGIPNIYDPQYYYLTHYMENALKAQVLFKSDRDYVVKDGEVIIVDEFTGRLMFGRRYSEGLHQAIEAKERVKIQRESLTLATITFQNYFRLYKKLAGMTGTAVTEAEELYRIYKLEVVAIPTNVPLVRTGYPDRIYKTEEAKFRHAAEEIQELNKMGRPVLVGTVSVEKSEYLSELLRRQGVPHQVLNAKNHEKEAYIVAQAGRLGGVTISTNMAGRGTDIILGGNPTALAEEQLRKKGYDPDNAPPELAEEVRRQVMVEWEEGHHKVVELGGLHVLGTEHHEARRIDNQLRGRSGRQGDPGSSRFYTSLEDEVLRRFGGDRLKTVMGWAGMDEDTPMEHSWLSKAIEMAQVKSEGNNFNIRKQLLDYDDVMNKHREVIYAERRKILSGADLRANIQDMVEKELKSLVYAHLPEESSESWNLEGLVQAVNTIFPLSSTLMPDGLAAMTRQEIEEKLVEEAMAAYEGQEKEVGPENMRFLERLVMLRAIDNHWVEHLTHMDYMRQSIGLQALAQHDPLVAYKTEAHRVWESLQAAIQNDIAHTIFHARLQREEPRRPAPMRAVHGTGPAREPARVGALKVGRNDPCPCGSGKKYKKCCGA